MYKVQSVLSHARELIHHCVYLICTFSAIKKASYSLPCITNKSVKFTFVNLISVAVDLDNFRSPVMYILQTPALYRPIKHSPRLQRVSYTIKNSIKPYLELECPSPGEHLVSLCPLPGPQGCDDALGLLEAGHLLVSAIRRCASTLPTLSTLAALAALTAVPATTCHDSLLVLQRRRQRTALHRRLVETAKENRRK